MANGWNEYQDEAAEFFQSLGLATSTNVRLQGVRTSHDIDVLVEIDIAGFQVRWIVECKHWRSAVSKLHILALREIVADIGADRGIILCEEGFQSGAIEAAELTNVQVTSLSDLSISSKGAIYAARLRDLYDRNEICRERYWDIPKDIRIEKGLRFDIGDASIYSGARVVDFSHGIISQAFRGSYPIAIDIMQRVLSPRLPETLDGPEDVIALIEPMLAELEAKLDAV